MNNVNERDIGTLSSKWKVFTKNFTSGFTNPLKEEAKNFYETDGTDDTKSQCLLDTLGPMHK